MSYQTTVKDLVPRQTVESMCKAFHDAMGKYESAMQLINEADVLLKNVFDSGGLPYKASPEMDAAKVRREVVSKAWTKVFHLTGLKGLMSLADQRKLDQQLCNGENLPDLTAENVYGLLAEQQAKIPDLMTQAVKEVFEMIRPGCFNTYVTNEKNHAKVGKKWIFTNALDTQYTFSLRYRNEDEIRALDNVFRLLDGKGPVTEHCSETVVAIQERIRGRSAHQGTLETTYFKVKYFMNGNLHIEFKRMDLVAELNRIGAEGKYEISKGAA